MMNFQVLEQSILDDVLAPAEAGRYQTVGAQRQSESAQVVNETRKVMVFYTEGDFPKSAASIYGDVQHNTTFEIVLVVAVNAEADLSVLNDENASAADKANALRQMREPSLDANREMNDFIALIYQILMDGRNEQLGINPPGDRPNLKAVSGRWVDQIRKNDPLPDGEYVTLTATMRLTCTIEESLPGEDLVDAGNKTFESDITHDGDTAQAGVEETTP
jgi:hypothetical protein